MSKQTDKISQTVLSTPLSILSGGGEPICSLATQPGGAIGVIRVSGEKAIEVTDKSLSWCSWKAFNRCEREHLALW